MKATCDLYVPEGETIEVPAGSEIWMPAGTGIYVGGTFETNGTAAAPVILRTFGAPDAAPASDNTWAGVVGQGGSKVSLAHTEILRSQGVSAPSDSISITDSHVSNTYGDGITATEPDQMSGAGAKIKGNTVDGSTGDAIVVEFNGSAFNPDYLRQNSGSQNGRDILDLIDPVVSEDVHLPSAETYLTPVVERQNRGGLSVDVGAKLTLDAGALLKMGPDTTIEVGGKISINGTQASPAAITSIRDDGRGGDSNGDGNLTSPARGDWSFLVTYAYGSDIPAEASITNAYIGYGLGLSFFGPANVQGSTIEHTGSTAITGNGFNGADLTVSDSTIRDTSYDGISSTGDASIQRNQIFSTGHQGISAFAAADGSNAGAIKNNTVNNAGDYPVAVYGGAIVPSQLDGNTGSGNKYNSLNIYSGQIIGNVLWDFSPGAFTVVVGNPYGSSLTVNAGSKLTIQPGQVIKFQQAFLNVYGQLVVNGTASQPVVLTSYRDDSSRGDSNGDGDASAPGYDWVGIQSVYDYSNLLNPGLGPPKVTINHGDVRNSVFGLSGLPYAVDVEDSQFKHIATSAISIGDGGGYAPDDLGTIRVLNNHVSNSGHGTPGNIYTEGSFPAISLNGARHQLSFGDLAGNTGSANALNDLAFANVKVSTDTTLNFGAGTLTPAVGNSSAYTGTYGSGLLVTNGATLTLPAGSVLLSFGGSLSVDTGAHLIANGTSANPVTITSAFDARYANDPGQAQPGQNDFYGVDVDNGGSANLQNTEIKYAYAAINVADGGTAQIHGKITHSNIGVKASSYVDATNVDWGTSSGPSPYGSGPPIQGPVDVVPWVGYQSPSQPATTSWTPTPNVECRDFFVIGVRGSGELPQGSATYSSTADGFGTRTWNNYLGLKEALAPYGYTDSDFKLLGLHYPALSTDAINFVDQSYYDSIFLGVDRLISELYAQKSACGSQGQRAILAGYSQGALVIHLALRILASSDPSMLSSSNIAGVMLDADPAKTASGNETLWEGQNLNAGSGVRNASGVWDKVQAANHGPIPAPVDQRTISICHNHDIFCAPGAGAGVAYHIDYSAGELKAMGAWIANVVR